MRAGPLLSLTAAAGAVAVGLLLLGPGGTDQPGVDRSEAALVEDPVPSPEPPSPAPFSVAIPAAAPVEAEANRAAQAPGTRVPHTLQSLHGRVSAPAGLTAGVRARVIDSRGEACTWVAADGAGNLVLELSRPVERARIEFDHPALAPLFLEPFDVPLGERRGFGLARMVPARTVSGSARLLDGAPAAGAEVFVLPPPGRLDSGVPPVTADGAGDFTLSGVPPRHGGLLFLHPGAAAYLAEVPPPTEPLVAELFETERRIEVLVLDELDQPLGGVAVELHSGALVLRRTVTDDEGRAGFGPLPELALEVSAETDERPRVEVGGVVPRADPGAVELVLEPGDDPEDADDEPQPRGHDRGWLGYELTDAQGQALPGALLELWDRPPGAPERFELPGRREEPLRAAFADQRGWALWQDLDDGPWWMVARAAGQLPAVVGPERAREDDPEPPLLSLEPAATLRGIVIAVDGSPVMSTPVDLTSSADRGAPLRLRLLTDRRGRFEAPALPLGNWTARALAPPGFEALGTSENELLELTAGEVAEIELILTGN
ncbi:carboxypeptidase-like regulatory domain-containing protein [Engelhardtia mirabilis]|uniref:Uncharacterized protein n=1 Tax=Engelhardtia mirabilis TaxID=2528011 RepID=A0A518BQ50_9BACT|nr:hypothetical protein Pla133_42210 [Planctomycetes bacterium Pla133]QDV03432.1 hypothetical protein Pla86_42200 [Planctomycetes bacterium Pla86]